VVADHLSSQQQQQATQVRIRILLQVDVGQTRLDTQAKVVTDHLSRQAAAAAAAAAAQEEQPRS
jgi:hypothetical protein